MAPSRLRRVPWPVRVALGLFLSVTLIFILWIARDFLSQKITDGLALLRNVKRGILSPAVTALLPPLTFLVTAVASVATCLYLFVTWRLLVQAHRAHEESQRLTRRLHADSLTPFICLWELRYDLFVTSQKIPAIRVHSATPIDAGERMLQVNSLSNLPIDDLIIGGRIDVVISNASTNVADTSVSILGICGDIEKKDILRPNSIQEFHFDVSARLQEVSKLVSLLSKNESIKVLGAATGPSGSARDGFEAHCPISLRHDENESPNPCLGGWSYIKRFRVYDEDGVSYA